MGKRSAAVAATRFGLGARPGDLDLIRNVDDWVMAQLVPHKTTPRTLRSLASSDQIATELRGMRKGDGKKARELGREHYRAEAMARTIVMVETEQPLVERLVRFWSNHFTVSGQKGGVVPGLVGAYEREAIRPHVTGRFLDLLTAAVHHPAMLFYLDQSGSVGPLSKVGLRNSKRGLNENLARELLELHTLGVDGGYSQADVESFARVLSGLSVDLESGASRFAAERHEPGSKELLGQTWAAGGADEMTQVLAYLAMHPSTMRHVCTKLARHFVDDDPPADVVEALTTAWRQSGGHIGQVMVVLAKRDEAWGLRGRKIKTPEELVISAARGLVKVHDAEKLLQSFKMLGQEPWMAPSPAGWPDTSPPWTGPDAVLRRIQWGEKVARLVEGSAAARAPQILGELLSTRTKAALESGDGMALLLACPEFQRR